MPYELNFVDGSQTIRLWNARETERNVSGETNAQDIYYSGSDETLISDFESKEEGSVVGVASANRLSNQSEYSNDRVTALGEFVQRLMTACAPKQGTGWELTDPSRGDTINLYVENVQWQRNEADRYQVQYSFDWKRGRGMGSGELPSPGPVNPQSTATLDGVDLGALQSWSEKRKQDLKVYALALEDLSENTVRAKSGVTRRINIRGRPTDTRNDIESLAESLKGSDQTVTYQSAFPGEEVEVALESYDSTREQQWTEMGEFGMQLVEGTA